VAFCFVTEGDFSCVLAAPPCILPSRAHGLVGSNLAAAREVLGVVNELLMNPVNFHVDDPSHLINGRSD
jgi:hypothetical protein